MNRMKTHQRVLILVFIVMGMGIPGFAQNPIIADIGISDPHVRVFNDTLYLYSGHDDHPGDSTWVMKDWFIFSTTDLCHWKIEGTISPKDNYMDDYSRDCWAGDAVKRNEKYYFYFSDKNRSIGVMESKSPIGRFVDPIGKPLTDSHDPTILVDDDAKSTPYMVYGTKRNSYHIARLNDDMISLAETPKPIVINGKQWEDAPYWMDKNYIFKHNGLYYLIWAYGYATSSNIYGPYESRGVVGKGHHLDEYAHGSFFNWKGQFYHIWCYYKKPGLKYREVIISYCHFDNKGNIVTDTGFLDKHFSTGVGQYDASWDKIEAEWFYEKSSDLKKQECSEGGFEIAGIKNVSWLKFSNVDFSKSGDQLTANLLSRSEKASIEIRLDSLAGPLLGKLSVPDKRINEYCNISTKFKKPNGKRDVYLKFVGNAEADLLNLNWFSFSNTTFQ